MADFPTQPRTFRAARATLLAFGATFLILLPIQAATAQTPTVDDCVKNPASCVPLPETTPLPELDKCTVDPASCLPEPPKVDECTQNPASCLPEPPKVDECTKDPASCLPEAPKVDECTQDPASCLPATDGCERDLKACAPQGPRIDGCAEAVTPCHEHEDGDQEESDGGEAAPDGATGPPGSSPDATGRTEGPGGSDPDGDQSLTSLDGVSATEGSETSPVLGPASTLERISRGLKDAAERFAFPLVIAVLVGGFLLLHGRLDRKDPKLASAPIDSRDDMVMFQ